MFGLSFSELFIVFLIALVVLGPERLPVVARSLGRFYHRIRRYIQSVRQDISQEIDLDSFLEMKIDLEQNMQQFEARMAEMQQEMAKTYQKHSPVEGNQEVFSAKRILSEQEQMDILLDDIGGNSSRQENNEVKNG